nr:hypothetical protein [Tanacetum cinerariifolium]
MSSLFADTHNVVAILEKSDAAEGFKQIIDFLSGSYIHYALTVNPHIYISCIKQFWNTAFVKRSTDVTRLQALVDKKKIVIFEAIIREILQLDDAKGVVCLSNEEIFAGLAQMGYEKPSTKFYKAFFSRLGKVSLGFRHLFLRETIVEDVAHEAILSTPTPLILPSLPSHKLEIIKLKARVKKLERANKVKSSKLKRLKKVEASRRIESSNDLEDVFNQGRMINEDEGIELVKDVDIAEIEGRHAAEQAEKQAEIYNLDLDHPSKVLNVVTAALQISAASVTISAAKPSIPAAAPIVIAAYTRRRKGVIIRDSEEESSFKTLAETLGLKDKGKGILIESPKPMKKKDQIELDAKYARKLHEEINKDVEEINKDIDWDVAIDHVKQQSMENQYIKRYHGMKKKPQTEGEARKNMMFYLKNTIGYKMDFFKGMSYDEICLIFQDRFDENMRLLFKTREEMEEEKQEIIKSINETPAHKAAKRRKLNE